MTAGYQSARAKDNLQLPEDHPLARELRERIVIALERNPLVHGRGAAIARLSAAIQPLRRRPLVWHPRGQRHPAGTGTAHRIRTDLSATLFLTPPEDYDGGELMVEDTYGTQSVKLPAGHLVLYPSTSLHHVRPVTRGARISSFFWIQSMIRDDGQRTLLFDLDMAIQRIAAEAPDHPTAVQLTGVYHNLIRMWAEV